MVSFLSSRNGPRGLREGKDILLQRKELVTTNEDLVASLEGFALNTLGGLNGEVDLVDGSEDLVNLADLGLLQELVSSSSLRQPLSGRNIRGGGVPCSRGRSGR